MAAKAWSYSALSSFETCAKKHYHTRVKKDVKEEESEQMKWGNQVHKALEDRVRDGVALPKGMEKWESLLQRLLDRPGTPIAEQQMCLDKTLAPTTWFAKNAWARAIVDFAILDGDKALALDWKTGKPKEDHDQMMMFAAFMFHHYPELDRVITGYVWLAYGNRVTTQAYYRSDLPKIWQEFLPRVKRYQIAHDNNDFKPNPSGLCRKWCPVLSCVHNGRS
jgi:ATP-dependent exoDNAse (exonuclease V) beta subunit